MGKNSGKKQSKSANNGKKKQSNNNKPIRYGIVGLGHIAQVAVLPAFENAENSVIGALISHDDEKLKVLGKRYDVEHLYHYDEYEKMLADDVVDAVYIALPNHLHCEYTIKAARAGVHILCEKPMAVTEEECRKMIEAAEENDVRLMIAYRLHFEEANLEAIEIAQSGELGEIRFFESVFSQNVVAGDVRLMPISQGGGTVYDMGVYCINAARYIFQDEPLEVIAMCESSDDERFDDSDEMTSVIMRFPGNRMACFLSSFGASNVSEYRVVGTKGEIALEPAYGYATRLSYVVNNNGKSRARTFEKRDQFGPELLYFSKCILEGKRPEPDGYEGLQDVKIVNAIYESARKGRPIRIESVPQHKRPSMDQKITRPGIDKPDEFKAQGPKGG